ncbi:hypothetical protein MN205_06345 [Kineococcus sp. TRM81007]|uniref:hypothetical protein n=1 Tax=Kineococcus sp. TRM81007 TaxID=2925831 RepID=UPI001F578D9C|nr:hypothetical protein [Kineococcus sp. TRM81007]MCI2238110.1 hypothetical protein [Kineococcus sp. TRM81007]
MRDGATWVIKTTVGWWLEVPSIDLAGSPAVQLREYVWWLAIAVAAGSAIWQGVRMAATRRAEPLLDVGRGLVTLALWAGIGITGPALALQAGDAFSVYVLDKAASGRIADRLVQLASLTGVNSAGAVILLGLIAMLAGLVQAVLMIFREGAVVVLAGTLVLAAAGNATQFGRPWLMKLLGWMLALVCFKPVAALVYATALVMTGEGTDPRTVIVGLTMMVLAVAALPVLMKLFSWATGSAGHSGSLAGAAASGLGATATGVQVGGALRSRSGAAASASTPATGQAQNITRDLGAFGGGPTGAAATAGAGASAAAGVAGVAVAAAGKAVDLTKKAGSTAATTLTERSDGTDRSA